MKICVEIVLRVLTLIPSAVAQQASLRVPIYSVAGLKGCPYSHIHRVPVTFHCSHSVTFKQNFPQHMVDILLCIFTSRQISCLIHLHIYILAVDIMEPVLEWAAKCCCLRSLNP